MLCFYPYTKFFSDENMQSMEVKEAKGDNNIPIEGIIADEGPVEDYNFGDGDAKSFNGRYDED